MEVVAADAVGEASAECGAAGRAFAAASNRAYQVHRNTECEQRSRGHKFVTCSEIYEGRGHPPVAPNGLLFVQAACVVVIPLELGLALSQQIHCSSLNKQKGT